MDLRNKRILVTGGNGFLGKHLVTKLKAKDPKEIIITNSKDDDLRLVSNCQRLVENVDVVFHLAANVGGIGLNREKPADLFFDNIMMGTQLMHESKNAGVKKYIGLGTICSYPKFTSVPFNEDSIWDGYPEETNAPYGLAKKMLLVQSQAYRQQHDFNSIIVIPTNLYGPDDNYSTISSHVIPALILKIHEAKQSGDNSITVWGDGTPTRDFLFVDDAAEGLVLAAERYEEDGPLNLGSSEEISIKQVVSYLSGIMEFDGEIIWDETKPNGQPRRCVSFEKAQEKIGFKPKYTFKEGLEVMVKDFRDNLDKFS